MRLPFLDGLGLLGRQKRERIIGRHIDRGEDQSAKAEKLQSTLHAQARSIPRVVDKETSPHRNVRGRLASLAAVSPSPWKSSPVQYSQARDQARNRVHQGKTAGKKKRVLDFRARSTCAEEEWQCE